MRHPVAKVYKWQGRWLVQLFGSPSAGEYHFSEWADALAWAVRMVGA